MSYYPNPNRHVYVPSSTHTRVSVRPNLSWSTIQEESSTDLLSSELNEKQERIDRLKKLERLKERRYMDYQSLKRRGSSKEYSERFQRDCEEFNKLKYRQVHHKKSSLHVPPSKHRSISVSDVTNRHYFTSSRYGRTYLRGNQDDGQTLSPTGSISSIVTLDDDYMYGSRYSAEDHWGSWQPRSRTSSFSTSMARDRLGYGLSSHEMLDDNLFDDASSEYSYSGYMPQRRAFSSSVTPRRYTGLMTPTAQSADAIATEERMNQLSERLRTLQNERLQLERRRSVDLSSSHVRSHLPSSDSTETATSSVYSRFNQNSQTNILPQSPTDHSVPHWSQRVNLLLSSHQGASNVTSDMEYGGSHFEYGSRYTTDGISKFGSELPDSTLSADVSSSQSFHSTDLNESHDGNYHSPTLKSSILSRSFIYQKPEITSTPLSNPTFETRQERISVHSPSHLSMTTAGTHQESFPFGASHGHENSQFRHGNVRRVFNMNLQQPTNSSTTHVLRDGQLTDSNHNYQRSSEKSNINEMPLSPLSPASRKSFMTYEKKSVITQSGQQDEVSDSGVESASDVGRVSSSVSSDSISKFLVSASKPSESRGVPKFEIGFESPGQREYGPKLSPGGTTYHSVQEGTARDGQNSTSYPSPTTSRDGTYSSEFQHLQGSKMDIETTKENNTDEGQHSSVEADKAISGGVGVVTRKEKIVDVEHPASTKLVNVEMAVSQPQIGDISYSPDDQTKDISQQQRTKTMVLPETKGSAQKKQVSSDVAYAEYKFGPTATLKMATQRCEEFTEEPYAQLEQNQKQPEETMHDIKKTFTDSQDALRKAAKTDMPTDNSSIFQPDATHSETRRMVNTTTTSTVVKMVDNSVEQSPGIDVPYNQNSSQPLKSNGFKKDAMFQGTLTTSEVSATAPLSERMEIHTKRLDMNSDNLSKSLAPSNQDETPQLVYKTISDKLESSDVYAQKTVEESSPNVTENIQEIYASKVMESKIPEEQNVSDLTVITPKKKKSRKKKSLKGGENNGLDSSPKPEEPVSVNQEFCPSVKDGDESQSKTAVSSLEITRVETDNIPKTEEMATPKVDSLQEIYQNGTKLDLDKSPQNQAAFATSKQPAAEYGKLKSVSAEFPGQGAELGKDGELITKVVTTTERTTYEMNPEMQSRPEAYNIQSVTGKLPEKTKDPKLAGFQEQGDMFGKVTTTTKTIAYKTSEMPEEEFNVQKMSAEFPGQVEDPRQMEFTQGNLVDKVATITKTSGYKIAPGMSERPEEYHVQSISAEFPDQIKSPMQTDFTQGNTADKATPTPNAGAYKMVPGMSDKPEVYKLKSLSTELPAQQTELGKDGELITKVVESKFDMDLGTSPQNRAAFTTNKQPTVEYKTESQIKTSMLKSPQQERQQVQYPSSETRVTDQFKPGNDAITSPKIFETPSTDRKTTVTIVETKELMAATRESFEQLQFLDQNSSLDVSKDRTQSPISSKLTTTSYQMSSSVDNVHIPEPGRNSKDRPSGINEAVYKKPEESLETAEPKYSIQDIPEKKPSEEKEKTPKEKSKKKKKNSSKAPSKGKENGTPSEEPARVTTTKHIDVSSGIPSQEKDIYLREPTKQADLPEKVITTSSTETTVTQISETPEIYNLQSAFGKFGNQGTLQTQSTQGNMADKETPTIKMAGYKMGPGMSDKSEGYKLKSISAEFPGQQAEFGKDGELITKVVTTTERTTYEMNPEMQSRPEAYDIQSVTGKLPEKTKDPKLVAFQEQGDMFGKVTTTTKTIAYKTSEMPEEEFNVQKMSAEFPGQVEGPRQMEFTQGNLVDKVATITKTSGYKIAPGMSERPEEYHVQSISAEFPDQIKSPMQTDFTQGNIADKAAPTIQMPAYKMAPGISERPQEYNIQTISAEFPEQIKSPMQTDFTQGNIVDKAAPTIQMPAYKMTPGISDRPQEYNVQSISAEFPEQIKSPMQSDFTQGYGIDKGTTIPASGGRKTVPELSDKRGLKVSSMPEEFPDLLEGPKYDEPPSPNGTPYMSQASYKAVLERGIKPMEHIVPPTTQSTDISFTTKTHQPNVSYTLNGNQPEEKTESLETLHFTLEKPVTTVKPLTHTLTTDLTDSPVDKATYFSVKSGATQIQEPTSTLSQYDPKSVIPSISTELPENLKSSDIDASVSYSTDFSTASAELGPRIQSKSWSDVVKTGKTVDANLDRSQPNISPSLSIDKVEKPGDRSPHIQQTENEDRTMSGGSETFAIISPDGTSLPEYAALSSGDVVAPLKSKPPPPAKPLLRKLSGHDFNVTDIQKTAKPALKLVAPDCTLLQTKFETDGWKPKVKSPTITKTMTTTIVQSELIRQSPDGDIKTQTPDLEHSSVLPPVAPKRRSREFRSMSEESTDGESASPTATLHFKTQVDIPVSSPQGHPPQPPKRRHKKSSKSNSGSMSPDVSGSKDFNLDDSKRVSQTEFRMSDQDVFRDSLPGPTSPLESETKQNVITEKVISLNKSPHVSITSDSVNVENLEELKTKPRVMPKPNLKETPDSYFVLDDSPTEKNPPFERSYSADKSRTLPLHRKKIGSHSNNSDSDSEEKKQQPLSPNSNQKRWKSVEFFKDNQIKPDADVPPKNTGLNRVKSTSIKLLSKLQPKSKKSKSPRPDKEEEDYSPGPHVKTGHGATKEYPTLEKYPGNKNKEPSSPRTPDSEKFQAAAAPVAPLAIPLPLEEDEEPVKERVYLSSWDPTPLLKELYEIRLMDDDTEDLSYKFIEMEGLMEKLPMNKKKATLLKTWKRRYFRAKNGWLVYYDNRNDEKPSDELLLMGGQIHAMGNQVIGIDDGGGRYLMVRCPSQKEYEQWLTALESQITDNTRATYVRPSLNALKHPNKKVVMIEFGSMSIRAGILKENATLPQLFFPNAVAVSNENNMVKHVIGFDAYKPEVRHSSQLVQPFGPTDKVDKFKVDFDTLPSVFTAIFKDLKIATEEYYVMLILPLNIRDEEKSILMNILINQFKVSGVCMAPQALLALYSYNTQSGIIVDIGERLEVLPIYEGFVIDGGHTVQSFGAPKIRQSLRSGLTSENYPLYSPLEQLLVRLVQEETCFVSKNFNEDCQQYQKNPEKYQETLYLKKYNIPDEIYTKISHSLSRFVSPEGLFNTDLWGMDYPTIQSLVMNAIQACPMDNRRHLCRSIYLSGGVTLLPGFASRLESELRKRLNETIVIQVHASPQRYHAAYIGACALCSMSEFEKSCITSEEWKKDGTKAFQKWKMTS